MDAVVAVLDFVVVVVVSQAVANYCNTAMFKFGRRLGIRSRAALVSAVFRKAMVLDISGANAGQLQVGYHRPVLSRPEPFSN